LRLAASGVRRSTFNRFPGIADGDDGTMTRIRMVRDRHAPRIGTKGSSCMARTWPSFITRDLGESPEDDAEMLRRWERDSSEMQAIVAAGCVHQDADGWWIDDATGDLIGPDPEVERLHTDEELVAQMRPFVEAQPEIAASILRDRPDLARAIERARPRGRPPVERPRQ
jgi:hypothetical protein